MLDVDGMKLLKISSCPPWLIIRGDLIVIREVYERLHRIIHCSPITRLAIVGNPGIGKSYFALYELFIAVKERKRVVFYYQPTNTSYVFAPTEGNCWCEIGVACGNNCDLYLYDCATKSNPVLPAASNIIMFCSPDIMNYQQFIKEHGDILYMPVWTPAEMSAFGDYGRTNLGSVSPRTSKFDGYEERQEKFGCIPRYVFGLRDYEKSLEDACSQCTAQKLFKWGKELHISENTSHMVLHLIPDDTFKEIEYVNFASPYVQRKVLNAMEKCSYSDTLKFLERAKQHKELATLRGHMFEAFAHKELRKGGTFTVKNLETNVESNMVLQKCDNKEFHDPSKIVWAKGGVYWTPEYPAFCSADAIYTPNYLFQMTVSSSHQIQASGIEKIFDAIPHTTETLKLYFVVPSDVFGKFAGLQPIYKNKRVVKQLTTIKQRFEQYVLCIDTEQ